MNRPRRTGTRRASRVARASWRKGAGTAALFSCNPGSGTFQNIRFEGNMANTGGAVYAGAAGAPLFVDCVFHDNFAGEGGAAASRFGRPTFDRCRFEENESVRGGAIYDHEGGIICRNATFLNNHATTGGAVHVQFGITRGRFETSYFWNNQAPEGAAVYATNATVDFDRCVFVDNEFPYPDYFPAQVHYAAADGAIGRSVFFAGPGRPELVPMFCEQGLGPEADCNLFWPSLPPDDCDGITNAIVANPFFCAPGRGDFGLRPDSPCLPENDPSGCGGFGPETEPSCPLPAVDIRSLGGSLDVQTLEEKMGERR
ncbi:MAG: right-handed parallel beta-helix repeat-containing protein [Candidatus Eisenbacteria bacterium]